MNKVTSNLNLSVKQHHKHIQRNKDKKENDTPILFI